ncbi:unnamed protein product [Brassicogethes aeneus]|uniref:Single domain-containing protein n=1 Tax=Brassicogethes aeneus TaxID=1431903 RepID=A0A9P0F8W1_BRAAE|nr:unnamed protein product [Brassicogethes aeneus]
MRFTLLLFLVPAYFLLVEGWVGIIEPDKDYKGDAACFTKHEELGEFKLGEEKRMKECAIAICETKGMIRITGCGVVAVAPPCQVVKGDLSKPYPKCCFEIKCPEDNKV